MGTRGLTIVKYQGETKVAQYGQWDHYPAGQGVTVLNFLSIPKNVETLREKLSNCYWIDPEKHEALIGEFTGKSSSGKGWMTMEESDSFEEAYPSLHRNTGAGILWVIADSDGPVPLQDQSSFVEDELFCEGVYTIDLDTNTFTSEFGMPIVELPLDNLPDKDGYLRMFKEYEEEVNV